MKTTSENAYCPKFKLVCKFETLLSTSSTVCSAYRCRWYSFTLSFFLVHYGVDGKTTTLATFLWMFSVFPTSSLRRSQVVLFSTPISSRETTVLIVTILNLCNNNQNIAANTRNKNAM